MSDEQHFDWIVVGSGAAGMAAALRGHDLGLRTLVIEATDRYGGSTAISGGVVWIPDNDDMKRRGLDDDPAEALRYLRGITRDRMPLARVQAYVEGASRVLRWFEAHTRLRLQALEAYADYYPEAPGGRPGGRSMEPEPFDATELGEEFARLRPSHPQSQILGWFGITAREAKSWLVPDFRSRLAMLWRFVQYAGRYFKRRRFRAVGRDTKLHAGNALIGRLRRSMMDGSIPLWLSCPLEGLEVEQGVVTGVRVRREGRELTLRARVGVMLAAGGFERNQEMRERYGPRPVSTSWNAGNERNVGDAIRLGMELGAAVDLMDQAWWTPVTQVPRTSAAWVLVVEKSLPGSLMVGRDGRRFCNEAGPYLDVGRSMYEGGAVPDCWLIFDAQFRRQYPVGPVAPGWAMPDGRLSRRMREEFFIRAATIEELAAEAGIDVQGLKEQIVLYNADCARGVDSVFGRGESATDRYYADERVGRNPCLRPLEKGPFYAIRVYPGDLGTKGGLVTDADGRVLDQAGQAIVGLYAAGNTSASVMGETYPGAGGTIGPALVFGVLAAEAAAKGRVA